MSPVLQPGVPRAASAGTPAASIELARAAFDRGDHDDALEICTALLEADAGNAAAWAVGGAAQGERMQLGPAVAMLERALSLAPRSPGWHDILCTLHRRANDADAAIASGQRAVALDPNHPGYLTNLAQALIDAGRMREARICLVRAIGLDHDGAEPRLVLAQQLLASGEMHAGWIEYEWRNRIRAAQGTMPPVSSAPWNGMALPDGRLVVVGDQGYGDTIQFARYLPLVARRCPETVLCVSPPLLSLLSRIPGPVACLGNWREVPPHAAHVRLSSLPYLFGTDLDTIPGAAGYLAPDPTRVARWQARLPPASTGLRVGLVWSGRPTHPNDARRSLRLAALRPLATVPGISFVSLQTPLPERDRADLDAFGMTDQTAALIDFDETAACIAGLDLVITIDSAVAHLAGAMGRPVWVLLQSPADWRWLLQRADSPWYDSAVLFRQPVLGDWPTPIQAAAERLRALAHGRP